jgi:hypothetical protein
MLSSKYMFLKTVYIFLVVFMAVLAKGYGQTFQWAKSVGGTDWDYGTAVAVDASGNVYHAGNFKGTIDFDPGAAVFSMSSGNIQGVFISKFDASGNFIWTKQLDGQGWEECNDITVDASGHIYVAGFFLGATDFDPSPNSFSLMSSPGGDAFICKLDTSGGFVWAKQFTGTLAVNSYSVATDSSGNVYTTGFFDGIADFDPAATSHNLTVVGYSDIFVSKLDSSGNFVWVKQMSGTDGEGGYAIAVDNLGNVYTTGTFFGTVDFDPGSAVYNLSSPGAQESYISKLNAAGDFVWARSMGGQTGYAIALDGEGNIYTTGYYGWSDIFVNKLDPSGNTIWSKQIGAFIGYSIDVDQGSNIYITGQFYGTGDFDPGSGTFNLTAIGSTDSYIAKLDSAGQLMWAGQLGGTNEVLSRSLATDGNGNVYTTGYFDGTADFNPAATVFSLTATGSYDIFLQKMDGGNLGLEENSFSAEFGVYPNPTDGNLFVEFVKEQHNLSLVVKNISGGIVATKFVRNARRIQLEIDDAPGMYLLELSDQDHNKTVVPVVKR